MSKPTSLRAAALNREVGTSPGSRMRQSGARRSQESIPAAMISCVIAVVGGRNLCSLSLSSSVSPEAPSPNVHWLPGIMPMALGLEGIVFFLSQSGLWRPLPGPQDCKGTEICQALSAAEGSLIHSEKDTTDPFPRLASRKLEPFPMGMSSQLTSIAPSLLDSWKHSPLGVNEIRREAKKIPNIPCNLAGLKAG